MSHVNGNSNQLRLDYFIIGWMLIVHLLAIAALPYASWSNFYALLAFNFIANCLGITLGYHRLLTHRTFKVSVFWERFFATCGLLSLQGSPLEWVAHHRMHHAGSDTPKDPHNANKGFWWSHVLWIFWVTPEFDDMKTLKKYGRDITKDPYMNWLAKPATQVGMQVALAIFLFSIGGIGMVLWGVFLRLAVCYHSTWLVNSATHFWGYQTYKDVGDRSRNNWIVAFLTWGEGWHNNHHRHENLAPAGHRWWELDITMIVIRVLGFFDIAHSIRDEIPKRTQTGLDELLDGNEPGDTLVTATAQSIL
jgi:sn-2 palmitoyl-lipid 9-desaturase